MLAKYEITTTTLTKNVPMISELISTQREQYKSPLNIWTQNHQSVALTSPESDSRCCWRELASLTNLFLGPTRSAKLPMMTLWWPWCSPLVNNLLQCLYPSLYVFRLPAQRIFASYLPASLTHLTHTHDTHLTFQRHNCNPPPPPSLPHTHKHTYTHTHTP